MPDHETGIFSRALASDFPYEPDIPWSRHPSTASRAKVVERSFTLEEEHWPAMASSAINLLRSDAKVVLQGLDVVHLEVLLKGAEDDPSKVVITWRAVLLV